MNQLDERIREIMTECQISNSALAEIAEVTRATVTMWLNGDIKSIKLDYAVKISEATGYNPVWIVLGKGPKRSTEPSPVKASEFIPVRKVIFRISAGIAGFSVDFLDNGEGTPVFLPHHWVEDKGLRQDQLYAIRVAGDSMIPSLHDGDTIVVNTGDTARNDGDVYAINFEGETTVKRLVRDIGQWWLMSDNADQKRYSRKLCDEGTYLLGKVVYKQSDKI